MGYKVLLAQDVARTGKDLLRENGYEVVVAPDEDVRTIKRYIKDCDAIFSKTLFLGEDVLTAGKKLKVVAKHGVGIDNVVDVKTATHHGIYVVNTPHANIESVAEHTVAAILALAKNILPMDRATRNADFDAPLRSVACEVGGKTIGLVGLGNIGKSVAQKAKMGFGMNVIGFDPYVNARTLPDYIRTVPSLDDLLMEADFVSLHVGATKETIGMMNRDRFVKMKDDAFFINFARGALVVEKDLVEVLQAKRIRGAALDVYAKEPIDPDNPLLQLNNVVLSPHSAALSQEAMDRMSYQGAMGIVEILSGKKPTWCVNYEEVRKGSGPRV